MSGTCYGCPHCGHCMCDTWAPYRKARCPICGAPAQEARFAERRKIVVAGHTISSYVLKCRCFEDGSHWWEIEFNDDTVKCLRCKREFRITSSQVYNNGFGEMRRA